MFKPLIVIISSLVLFACSNKPSLDYDSSADFSQYKTFAYAPMAEDAVKSLDDKRIEQQVSQQLSRKGMQAAAEAADMIIYYEIEDGTILVSEGATVGFSYTKRGRYSVGGHSGGNYKERKYGKIVISFVNPDSQGMIWRGISQNQLRETMSPEKRAEFITQEVSRMLENYPPAP